MTSRSWTACLVTFACGLAASPAAATPVAITSVGTDISFSTGRRAFIHQLSGTCVTVSSFGWGAPSVRRPEYTGSYGARGSFDGVTRAGDVHQVGPALQLLGMIRGPIRHPYQNAVRILDVGIETAGSRVYLTARLVPGKERLGAASRVRIAAIARPKFFEGPATVPRHPSKTVPDTFLMALEGQATALPPLTAAVKRLRCTRKENRFASLHPVKPGLPLGFVSVQLRPQGAVGVDGTAELQGGPDFLAETGDEIQVQPVAPARRVTTGDASGLRLPFAGGNRVALDCDGGSRCEAVDGEKLTLGGGFTAAANGRTATIDSLQVFYATPQGRTSTQPGLTGSVNGRPVTLVPPGDNLFTDESLAALSDALGVRVTNGRISLIDDTFTLTEPL